MRQKSNFKYLFGATLVVAAGFWSVAHFWNGNSTKERDIMLENVEALSNDEGTNVGSCYVSTSSTSGKVDFYVICDSKTSPEKIYPCPSNTTYTCVSAPTLCTK